MGTAAAIFVVLVVMTMTSQTLIIKSVKVSGDDDNGVDGGCMVMMTQ